ncbi:hypothetical protein BCV70DRAFT_186842 [Testicularia cyperi]|uniref:G-patch domain-containing protein n=1 Tax=Testicularia cyperi TaxID=1882483 RepID=A0A317XSS9_9BASI|nr:hypothetical protein BCV70DRAFT_186842 [Testicularia cyperi]
MAQSRPSKPARFDPRRIIEEIQAETSEAGSSSNETHKNSSDEDEDDFMSDKYLPTEETMQPLTYTDKRRRVEHHRATKSRPASESRNRERKSLQEREEEARRAGLDRDLLAEAEIIAGGGKLPPEDRHGKVDWQALTLPDSQTTDAFAAPTQEPTSTIGVENGTAKAMKMMLAMGYKRGQALGRRDQSHGQTADQEVEEVEEEEEEDDDDNSRKEQAANRGSPHDEEEDEDAESLSTDEEAALEQELQQSQAAEEDEYLAGGISTSRFGADFQAESQERSSHPGPLEPDQRWLGANRRSGLGMVPKTPPAVSKAIREASEAATMARERAEAKQHQKQKQEQEQEQEQKEADFLARVSQAHQDRHTDGLISRSRKTLVSLDRQCGVAYSPLWLDSGLYFYMSGHSSPHLPQSSLSTTTTLDEKMQKDPATRDAVELLLAAFSSDRVQMHDALTFCNLPPASQLDLILKTLRTQHNYCLFCGCAYQSAMELAQRCPGQSEDLHD